VSIKVLKTIVTKMTSNETKKKERWKTREQKYISEFTPRLQRDLKLFPTKEVQKEQEGRYIDLLWENFYSNL
jgi:hypothetical protein